MEHIEKYSARIALGQGQSMLFAERQKSYKGTRSADVFGRA